MRCINCVAGLIEVDLFTILQYDLLRYGHIRPVYRHFMEVNGVYFHASPIGGIKLLEPRISNHGIPLIYFSKKRENVLVYLSNAIEKYCKETAFDFFGKCTKWGSYGFHKDGTQRIEEYYPNALVDTYKGVSGYIYAAEEVTDSGFQIQIPDAVTSSNPVLVKSCEFVPDAYEAILAAEQEGLLSVSRYEDASQTQLEWIERTMQKEYEEAIDQPEYRHFIEGKFPFVK